MPYRALIEVLVARLALASWAGAGSSSLGPGPIQRSAARQAAASADAQGVPPLHRGINRAGIALVLAGGVTTSAALTKLRGDACRRNERASGILVGTSELSAGAIRLGIADARRRKGMPTVTVEDGRLLLSQRVTFSKGVRLPSRLAQFVVLALAGQLALAPFAAAEDAVPAAPIRAGAIREAAKLATTSRRGPMPAGLKWTGVGLLSASLLPVTAVTFGDCISDDRSCRDTRAAAYVVGGVMAGSGALLLIIGHAKRTNLPSLSLDSERAMLQQRITF